LETTSHDTNAALDAAIRDSISRKISPPRLIAADGRALVHSEPDAQEPAITLRRSTPAGENRSALLSVCSGTSFGLSKSLSQDNFLRIRTPMHSLPVRNAG
jgi:hypothetical protein